MPEDRFAAATAAILLAGQRMDRFGRVPATAGNISLRLPDGTVAITRSGGRKGVLDAEGVIRVDLQGRPLHAGGRPSAETGLHCGTYRRFPEAGMQVCRLHRAADGTAVSGRHPAEADFPGAARRFGLPAP